MCKIEMLRALLNQRLTAAAEEIFVVFERMIAEVEEELSRTKMENERQRQRLNAFETRVVLRRADVSNECLPIEQQESTSRVEQEQAKPPLIKEEVQPQELDFPMFSVIVKVEDDDEGKGQSKQNGAEEPSGNSSSDHMTIEGDGDHSGGSRSESLLAPLSDSGGTTSDTDYDEHSKEEMTCNADDGQWKCFQCDKTFSHKINLKRHTILHTGEKPFSCSVCGKKFTQKVHLTSHMKIHTGEKPFTCSYCGKSFKRKTNLTSHTRTHTGERPFSCPSCNKGFIDYSAMIKHTRTHTGEKPYSCSFCDKSFGASSTLVTHLRTHTGVKPFSCSVCDKSFYDCSGLAHHMKTHTGDKPFSCSVCGKSFRENSLLTRHMKTHTGGKMFICSVCDQKFSYKHQIDKHRCAGEKSSSA
ncbi:zinc finger protein OZF-like [Hippocampus zosterae]|uniref:zinc finger protein OZF-like n=1 Tax=Hippocampus zosterae TaxID=109293 RepID=UPI00223DA690|nr:zinc finger protein OZF-like [Hippocampus zosterae]